MSLSLEKKTSPGEESKNDPQTKQNSIDFENKPKGTFKEEKYKVYFYMQMEYCDGDSLASYLAKRIPIPRNLIFSILRQIVCALKHIHGNNVIHRDLKYILLNK